VVSGRELVQLGDVTDVVLARVLGAQLVPLMRVDEVVVVFATDLIPTEEKLPVLEVVSGTELAQIGEMVLAPVLGAQLVQLVRVDDVVVVFATDLIPTEEKLLVLEVVSGRELAQIGEMVLAKFVRVRVDDVVVILAADLVRVDVKLLVLEVVSCADSVQTIDMVLAPALVAQLVEVDDMVLVLMEVRLPFVALSFPWPLLDSADLALALVVASDTAREPVMPCDKTVFVFALCFPATVHVVPSDEKTRLNVDRF